MNEPSHIVCVVGASGFLGSAVVEQLQSRDCRVVTRSVRGRIDDELFWREFAEHLTSRGVQAVVNCAAARLVGETAAGREEVRQANRVLPERLAAAASCAGSTFIQVGSRWQLGEFGEGPRGFYARMKEEGEHAAREVCLANGIGMRSVLIRDTYGTGDRRDNLIQSLVRALRQSNYLAVTRGDQRIDVARVERVAASIVETVSLKPEDGSFMRFETGVEEPPTVRELIELFMQFSNCNLDVDWGARPYRSVELFAMDQVHPWAPKWQPDAWRPEFLSFVRSIRFGGEQLVVDE